MAVLVIKLLRIAATVRVALTVVLPLPASRGELSTARGELSAMGARVASLEAEGARAAGAMAEAVS